MSLYQYRVRFPIFVRVETSENLMGSSNGLLFFCLICMQLTKLSLIDISLREGQLFGRWICRENHPFGSGIFFSANTLNQDILTGKIS